MEHGIGPVLLESRVNDIAICQIDLSEPVVREVLYGAKAVRICRIKEAVPIEERNFAVQRYEKVEEV
jgi:hypothetical protein